MRYSSRGADSIKVYQPGSLSNAPLPPPKKTESFDNGLPPPLQPRLDVAELPAKVVKHVQKKNSKSHPIPIKATAITRLKIESITTYEASEASSPIPCTLVQWKRVEKLSLQGQGMFFQSSDWSTMLGQPLVTTITIKIHHSLYLQVVLDGTGISSMLQSWYLVLYFQH